MVFWLKLIGGLLLGCGLCWAFVLWFQKQKEAKRQRAKDEFGILHKQLCQAFAKHAEATGKPRGLHWKSTEYAGEELFALSKKDGLLYAFVAISVSFEAVTGGDMEEVEAVSNIRSATALFFYREGEWRTDGQTLFNVGPGDAVERLGGMEIV